MGERDGFAAGTPCWVDIGTPDTPGTAAYYGDILGWQHEGMGPDAGGYGQFSLRGKKVAGVGPQQNMDMPPYWTVYVASDDAAATVAKAEAAGATVLMPADAVFEEGSMAVLLDPLGTPISVWQAGNHKGAELVNEVGTFCWNELATNDLAKSVEFYTSAFGWTVGSDHDPDQATLFHVDGKLICGAHAAGEGEPPFWSVWFTVDDADAAAARTEQLGGSVVMPPNDMSFGRGTVVIDPQGAAVGFGAMDTPDP
jgi:hypothetical protein